MYFDVIGSICGGDCGGTVMSTLLLEFKRKTSKGRQAVILETAKRKKMQEGKKEKPWCLGQHRGQTHAGSCGGEERS